MQSYSNLNIYFYGKVAQVHCEAYGSNSTLYAEKVKKNWCKHANLQSKQIFFGFPQLTRPIHVMKTQNMAQVGEAVNKERAKNLVDVQSHFFGSNSFKIINLKKKASVPVYRMKYLLIHISKLAKV